MTASLKNQFGTASAQVSETRASMNKFMGQIIEDVVGEKRVRELFDTAGTHPEEYKDQPTGMIALKLGVITPGTKDALLIAQAAERTLRNAEKTEFYISNKKTVDADAKQERDAAEKTLALQMLAENKKGTTALGRFFGGAPALTTANRDSLHKAKDDQIAKQSADLGYVSLQDKTFAYIGSPNDAPAVKAAQGLWLTSQMYLNNELDTGFMQSWAPIASQISSVGPDAIDGLKKSAADAYKTASDMLKKEGHTEAAKKLAAVATYESKQIEPKAAMTPQELIKRISFLEEWAVGATNQNLDPLSSFAGIGNRPGYSVADCTRVITLLDAANPAAPKASPAPKVSL